MTVLTFRDVSKFSRVNAAIIADYEHVIIFKFATLHIRLWLKDDNTEFQFWVFDWMNLNEYKGWYVCRLPSASSHKFIPDIAKQEMFTYSWSAIYTEFHISIFWSRRSTGRNGWFVWSLRLLCSKILWSWNPKIMLNLLRTLKRYLKNKNLIHTRETATISKFSALVLETLEIFF